MNDQQEPTPIPLPDTNDGTAAPTPVETAKIVITFGAGVNEIDISMENVSPFMMWGASKMLDKYAQDLWESNQLQQAVAVQQAQQPKPTGLVAARAIPQDHRPPRRRN